MTRRELVLKKLHELPMEEVTEAIQQVTMHVRARMRLESKLDRTKKGAHSVDFLGMPAVDFYVGESIKRLYDPEGWDWKFEERSLSEQLIRIANKLISDKPKQYLNNQAKTPVFDNRDIGDIYDVEAVSDDNIEGKEEEYSRLIDTAFEVANGDDDLEYFLIRYLEGAEYITIAQEMGIELEKVHVLRKKIVRRLSANKDKIR